MFLRLRHWCSDVSPSRIWSLLLQNPWPNVSQDEHTDFKTDWHRLEVGIGAGCTISGICFVLVIEMLLRSADCSEELVKVRSPKKALIGRPENFSSIYVIERKLHRISQDNVENARGLYSICIGM